MHMIYQTRYSFFYPSPGWRSDASKQKDILFDAERLARRQYFFEKVTLQSLADQSDSDFVHHIVTSEDLPEPFRSQLVQLCGDMLGSRAHVMFAPPDPPRVHFRQYRWEHFNTDPWSTQIVLDDDDALAVDFTEKLRREAMAAKNLRSRSEKFSCLSHANGMTALFRDGSLSLHHLVKPVLNLGLAIVAPSKTRYNLFDISHNNVPRDRPSRVIYSQTPYFIRSLHTDNDSRGRYDENPVTSDEMDQVLKYFPLLNGLKADWATDF